MNNIFIKTDKNFKESGPDLHINLSKQTLSKKYLIFLLGTNLLAFIIGFMISAPTPEESTPSKHLFGHSLVDLKVKNYIAVTNEGIFDQQVTVYQGSQRVIEKATLKKISTSESYSNDREVIATIEIKDQDLKEIIFSEESIFSLYPYHQKIVTRDGNEKQIEIIF